MLIRPQELQPGDVVAILQVQTVSGIVDRLVFTNCRNDQEFTWDGASKHSFGVVLTKQNNEITFIIDCFKFYKDSIAIRGKLKVFVLNR